MNSSDKTVCRLWVLRRWNSFTPKVPVGGRVLGGGYLLHWGGTFLAIDPGFDFLENLYRIPMTVANLDAILITHGHLDHRADIEPILMMKRERLHRLPKSEKQLEKPLQLILSADSLTQLMPLLQSHEPGVVDTSQITVLTAKSHVDLRRQFALTIDTFKTEHIDYSVGIVLHLYKYDDLDKEWINIGLTSDTAHVPKMGLEHNLSNCTVVIAHLGTLSTKRLLGMARLNAEAKISRVLSTLKTMDLSMLKHHDWNMIVRDILEKKRVWERKDLIAPKKIVKELIDLYQGSKKYYAQQTKNHLEFSGVLHLFENIFHDKTTTKIGVISEFGEELGSFRHKISDAINRAIFNDERGSPKQRVLTGDIGLCLELTREGKVCERFATGEQCKVGNKRKCGKLVNELARCTRCRKTVPIRCIEELCIRHRDEGIYYNCPQCFDRETSPPSGPMIPLIGE